MCVSAVICEWGCLKPWFGVRMVFNFPGSKGKGALGPDSYRVWFAAASDLKLV